MYDLKRYTCPMFQIGKQTVLIWICAIQEETVVNIYFSLLFFFCLFVIHVYLPSMQLDISLSRVFYKWLLNQEHTLTAADLQYVDPVMARSFYQMEELLRQKKRIEADRSHESTGHC